MAKNTVPTTVGELLAATAEATSNIQRHRDAMAEVAAIAKAKVPQQEPAGGEEK